MRQVRRILRLAHEGVPHRQIALATGVGPSTVGDYVRRARAKGLSWPLPDELSDAALEGKLFKKPATPRHPRPLPQMAWVHQELKQPGVTLQLLWHEYLEEYPEGYRYTQFCEHYRRFRRKLAPSMRQVHRAGHKIFVDYSGKQPGIVDRTTGQLRRVELFVSVLGASSYVFAEATESQQLHDWIGSHVRMFQYFDGSVEVLVPDNLKSGVTRACPYEPGINRTYYEMAEHYGAVVIPARSGRAKDKAKVETSVLVAQRWILAALRNHTFFSLGELNAAIRDKLVVLNTRPMQRLGVSRQQQYEQLDRPALKPLPVARYELAEWSEAGVSIDYHVLVDRNFYSVPYQLVHERVEVRYSASCLEILFKGKRVASHTRLRGRGHYATCPEHMPAAHRAHAQWSPSRLIRWGEQTGPATGSLVAEILSALPHPEQGYRSCLGIMRLGKSYGERRLEAACERAHHLGSCRYRTVKNILSSGLDRQPLQDQLPHASPIPVHGNIRGADYYDRTTTC